MGTQTFLLVEGINLGANIYDTNQLSIVRGGSFLLKQAIVDIARKYSSDLEIISAGASSGLFLLKESSTKTADGLCKEIADYLSGHNQYSLLTFGIESCEATSLQAGKEQLLGQLRVHQLQGVSVVPDRISDNSPGPSDWSGVRAKDQTPQTVTYYPAGQAQEIIEISTSEKRRWQYGRGQKQDYYLDEVRQLFEDKDQDLELAELMRTLGGQTDDPQSAGGADHDGSSNRENNGYYFTRDLAELSTCDRYPDLSGKIAVFYADGNSFGKLQRGLLENAKEDKQIQVQKAFDTCLQHLRRGFLAQAIREMLDDKGRFPDMVTKTRIEKNYYDALRFETLLWGGDEMLFVMPAWIGFDFVQFFFEQTRDWKILGSPLTHSAGLVFCSAKTPIRIMRQLAQRIADHVKERTDDEPEGKRDAWDYMVLESIDYPTRLDPAHFMKERYGQPMTAHRPSCIEPGGDWKAQRDTVRKFIDEALPARQLYRIAQWLVNHGGQLAGRGSGWPPTGEGDTALEQLELRLLEVCEDSDSVEEGVRALGEVLGLDAGDQCQRAWIWLHLVELKDYIAPRRG